MKSKKIIWLKYITIVAFSAAISCTPDEFGNGLGLTESSLDAAFTVVPGDTPNKFTLVATSTNYIMSRWDLGTGAPATSSASGCKNSWFETYMHTTVPTPESDYSFGGKRYAISTWDGCGTVNVPFSGLISKIYCGNSSADNSGTYTATATGIAYLVIRGGGEDMKDGITIDNIEVRAKQ